MTRQRMKKGKNMGNVIAVCTSEEKGTQKKNVGSAVFVEDWGIQGDAHAGKWHRQVSLLSHDKIEAFRARGAQVEDGAFGENLVVSGIDFRTLPLGTRFTCNDVVLELTQIGKECHSGCEIYKVMGDCIMPREGVFTRVLHGGTISVGDTLCVVPKSE
jgi:MOSC domain-containing protein YiiM